MIGEKASEVPFCCIENIISKDSLIIENCRQEKQKIKKETTNDEKNE